MIFLDDLKAKAEWCYGRADTRMLVKTLFTDGTAAMLLYRLMQCSRRWKLGPLAMFFNKLNAVCCQCIIGRGADFGPEFVLIHSQGVVINGNVRGGRRVFVEHQVTIGAEKYQTPVLGDDVFIGAGAKIIGPVRVGNGARIGANAVVVRDVPANATVGGVPARVLRIRGEKAPDDFDPQGPSESDGEISMLADVQELSASCAIAE
jgi:serine O-acetyltransferase